MLCVYVSELHYSEHEHTHTPSHHIHTLPHVIRIRAKGKHGELRVRRTMCRIIRAGELRHGMCAVRVIQVSIEYTAQARCTVAPRARPPSRATRQRQRHRAQQWHCARAGQRRHLVRISRAEGTVRGRWAAVTLPWAATRAVPCWTTSRRCNESRRRVRSRHWTSLASAVRHEVASLSRAMRSSH